MIESISINFSASFTICDFGLFNTPRSVFNIEVEESFDYTKESDGNVTVFDRNISDFIIRAID